MMLGAVLAVLGLVANQVMAAFALAVAVTLVGVIVVGAVAGLMVAMLND